MFSPRVRLHPTSRRPRTWEMTASCAAASVSAILPDLRGRGAVAARWAARHSGSDAEWLVRMRGYEVVLPVASAQTWTAGFSGTYGEPHVDLLRPFIRPGTDVLDIGASLGLFTIPAARAAARAGARVTAVEPVPANVGFLRRNVDRNGVDDVVTVRTCALGARAGTVRMHVEGTGAGNAAVVAGIAVEEVAGHDRDGRLSGGAVDVPLTTVDALHPGGGRAVSAVKIDVEGYELDVLEGGEALVARDRPAILAEFNPGWLRSRGRSTGAAAEWARGHDYVVLGHPEVRPAPWASRRPGPAQVVEGEWVGGDVLLVPREHPRLAAATR